MQVFNPPSSDEIELMPEHAASIPAEVTWKLFGLKFLQSRGCRRVRYGHNPGARLFARRPSDYSWSREYTYSDCTDSIRDSKSQGPSALGAYG